jgi:hypothetical protein
MVHCSENHDLEPNSNLQASTTMEPTEIEAVVASTTIDGTQNVTSTEGEHMMHSQQVV